MMNMRSLRSAIGLGLLVLLGLAHAAAAADPVVQLKLSHWVPPTHPLHPALEAWAADIDKESGGTIKITIFPSEQLGKAFDHYDMARDGVADLTYVAPGYQPGRFPIMAATELPFLAINGTTGSAAIDAWYRKYAPTEMKDVHLCFAFGQDPGTFHSRKRIELPSDVKGLKVRPSNGTVGSFVTLLGGVNIQASAPQARDMLEKGVADALTFPWESIVLFGIDKVVKYHLDVPLQISNFVIVMNKPRYDSLSAAQKKVMDDHCNTAWAEKVATPWAEFEHGGHAKLAAEPGHELVELTPAQTDEWKKAAAPLTIQWAASVRKVGGDPDTILAELKANLAKYNAAF
jgi:TRAP-type transport system periplasmic protein